MYKEIVKRWYLISDIKFLKSEKLEFHFIDITFKKCGDSNGQLTRQNSGQLARYILLLCTHGTGIRHARYNLVCVRGQRRTQTKKCNKWHRCTRWRTLEFFVFRYMYSSVQPTSHSLHRTCTRNDGKARLTEAYHKNCGDPFSGFSNWISFIFLDFSFNIVSWWSHSWSTKRARLFDTFHLHP